VLKLLIVTQYFWPEGFRINDVARSLRGHNVEATVLTGKPNYPKGDIFPGYQAGGMQREKFHDIPVLRVPLLPRGRSGLRLALNYLSFVAAGIVFGPLLLRKKKFDAVFVYAPSPILKAIPAIFLGWLKGTPVILWVQDLWPASLSATGHVKNKLILKAVEHVVRFIYRHVDLLLVQSEAFVAPVQALAGSTPVMYYPNSGDDSFSAPTSAEPPAVEGMNAPFPVLFAGNIGTAQAVDVIVEAAELLRAYPDIQFVVVGDGSRRDWMLQEKAARKLDNIHLPGRFPVETMPAFMQRSAALLVTLADQEIFNYTVPSKLQSYLAAGRPIIAALNGEGARLVQDAGAGFAVAAEDGASLADAVLRLYRSPRAEQEQMGANGARYFAQHFSHEMLVGRLVKIASECIANRKGKKA
jgi:glycosyltransferase involved in cell wall biosynthesis